MDTAGPLQRTSGASERGGILFRSVVVILTLAFIGVAIYTLLGAIGRDQQVSHRKALAICEYGLMKAFERVHESPSATADIAKTEYEDGWYRVTMNRQTLRDTVFLSMTAEGHSGSSVERRTCALRLDVSGDDSVWVRAESR